MNQLQTDIEQRVAEIEPAIEVLAGERAGATRRVFPAHPAGVTLAHT